MCSKYVCIPYVLIVLLRCNCYCYHKSFFFCSYCCLVTAPMFFILFFVCLFKYYLVQPDVVLPGGYKDDKGMSSSSGEHTFTCDHRFPSLMALAKKNGIQVRPGSLLPQFKSGVVRSRNIILFLKVSVAFKCNFSFIIKKKVQPQYPSASGKQSTIKFIYHDSKALFPRKPSK